MVKRVPRHNDGKAVLAGGHFFLATLKKSTLVFYIRYCDTNISVLFIMRTYLAKSGTLRHTQTGTLVFYIPYQTLKLKKNAVDLELENTPIIIIL
jgi:hypothetical protein